MSSPERDEEIACVQSIYCDGLDSFQIIDETHFQFNCPPMKVSFHIPLTYPDPTTLTQVSLDSTGIGVSRMQMAQLKQQLDRIIYTRPNEQVLFDLTEEVRELASSARDDIKGVWEEPEEEEDEDYDWDTANAEFVADQRVSDETIVRSHMGSVNFESIMEHVPSSLRLLHAECVLRADLRDRFLKMKHKIQARAARGHWGRVADKMYDRFGQEEVVFHGTLRHHVGSIVASGFVVPGQSTRAGDEVAVRCGSTWGMGIYTSPDPSYSLSYSDHSERSGYLPGQKLIVCSVLMGRRREMDAGDYRRWDPDVLDGYDSHVSPNKKEFVVFDGAQLLPLFVLHLAPSTYRSVQALRSLGTFTADAREQLLHNMRLTNRQKNDEMLYTREQLTAQARKFLPDGFGAASGTKFIVEAIAPVDDDEEMWGDYQYSLPGLSWKGTNEFQWDRTEVFAPLRHYS